MSKHSIPRDQFNAIKESYQLLETGSHGLDFPQASDWQHVYAQGSDSKYGTMVYSDSLQAWRSPSIWEFYGDGPID